ncbi:hypothetical protein D6779_09100 [Candidatus Parcubacteria bacterium]|nr:MAG: hypothetical protein D6779_09100 [Candidatus Parcubacteria bacterium]
MSTRYLVRQHKLEAYATDSKPNPSMPVPFVEQASLLVSRPKAAKGTPLLWAPSQAGSLRYKIEAKLALLAPVAQASLLVPRPKAAKGTPLLCAPPQAGSLLLRFQNTISN